MFHIGALYSRRKDIHEPFGGSRQRHFTTWASLQATAGSGGHEHRHLVEPIHVEAAPSGR
jgi:hypothetical protein